MVNKKVCTSGRLLSMDLYFPLVEPPRTISRGRCCLWASTGSGCSGPLGGKLEADCTWAWAASHPVPARAQGCAESPQGPMRAPGGQKERPRFGLVAGLPQVPGQPLGVPAPWLRAGQEVLDDARVEGSGEAGHQQLGVQEQGEKFLVTGGVIHLQEIRQAGREAGTARPSQEPPPSACCARPALSVSP